MTSLSAVSIRHLELVTDPAGHTADRRKMHLAFPIGLARADCFDSEKPTVCLIYMVVSLIKLYNIQDVMKEKTVPTFMELTILLGYQTSISEICVIFVELVVVIIEIQRGKKYILTKVVRKLFLERANIEGPYKKDLGTSF